MLDGGPATTNSPPELGRVGLSLVQVVRNVPTTASRSKRRVRLKATLMSGERYGSDSIPSYPDRSGIRRHLLGPIHRRFGNAVGEVGLHIADGAVSLGVIVQLVLGRTGPIYESADAHGFNQPPIAFLIELYLVHHGRPGTFPRVDGNLRVELDRSGGRRGVVDVGRVVHRLPGDRGHPAEWRGKEEGFLQRVEDQLPWAYDIGSLGTGRHPPV